MPGCISSRESPNELPSSTASTWTSSPGSEDGLTALAKLQVEAGDPEEAVDLLREFLKQHPASGRALEGLGEAYTQLEQYDKAADAYNRAIDLDEGDAGLKRASGASVLL